ncbi:MAG: DUF58 domain-containing protein [bacterium]
MDQTSAISSSWAVKTWKLVRKIIFPEWLFNRRVRISRSGYMFMFLVALIGVASFNTGNNLLYLVLAMLLSTMLFSFSISEYMIAGVRIERHPPDTVTQGRVFSISYTIKNRNRLVPALALQVREKMGNEEVMAYLPYLTAGEERSIKGRSLASRRGRINFRETLISTSAPLGLFKKAKKARLPGEVIALPSCRISEEDRELAASRGAQVSRHRRGRGDELFGFREYVRGDRVKDIHWKTSARRGKLMIKEREQEEERKVRIMLTVPVSRRPGRDETVEEAVHKAASLAASAVESGWMVRVEANQKGVDYGSGWGHLQAVLYFLALFDDPDTPTGIPLPPDDAPAITVP